MKMIKIRRNKILGEGCYGQVFKGVWNGKKVAVKRIYQQFSEHNIREELALKRLNHPNVLKLLHVENDEEYRNYAFELCEASLDQLFLKDTDPRKYQGSLSLSELDVLYQLATGLEFIHKMGLIHRDIKPENVLIWKDPKTKEVLLKWADFGLSKQVNERGTFTMSGIRGTYDWLAPEVLKLLDDEETSQFKISGRGTIKSDVFVEGLVFGYYLLNGLHPFGSRVKIQFNIFESNPVNLPKIQLQYARELIEKMLNPDPANRLSSTEVIQELELIKVNEKKNEIITAPYTHSNLKELIVCHEKILGEGGFGKVYQGVWNGKYVAIKQIPLFKVKVQEEEALESIDHPNVIKLFYAESNSHFRYYALELCKASLDKLFLADEDPKKYRGPAMPPDTEVLHQLAIGLEYIHQMGLIHGDIKHENVLIHVDSTEERVLMKWADFGLSKTVKEKRHSPRRTHPLPINERFKGTSGWLAPEILKSLEDQEKHESQTHQRGTVKSDVFAEGLVFGYYLLKGRHLYGSRFNRESNIMKNDPVNLSEIQPQYLDLIQKMLEPHICNRISSSNVVQILHNKRSLVDLVAVYQT